LLCPNNMLYRADGLLCDPSQSAEQCASCLRRYDFWFDVPHRRSTLARLVSNVRLFIAPSQNLIDLHVAAGYDRHRFRHVPNGIRVALDQPLVDYRVWGCVCDRGRFHTLLFAGAVVSIKGVQVLIDALPSLSRHIDRFRLIVAGVGEEYLLAELRRHEPAVQLLGRVPFQQMRALYAAADLTVTPSLWFENAPMTIAESLLAGTPALASAIGGIPEFIEDGVTGYLFPPGDAGGLVERAVQHLARPASERRAMRRQCVEYARRHLALDVYLDRLDSVYAEVVGG